MLLPYYSHFVIPIYTRLDQQKYTIEIAYYGKGRSEEAFGI